MRGIKAKLIGGFIAVLFVFASAGIYEVQTVNKLARETDRIFLHPMAVTHAALNADRAILAMHRSMKDIVLSQSNEELNLAIASVQDQEQKAIIELEIIQERMLGDEGKKLAADFFRAFIEWEDARTEVIGLVRAGEKEKAIAITKGKGADHVRILNAKADWVLKYAQSEGSRLNQETQSLAESQSRINIVIMIVSLFLGGAIAAFISFSVSSRIEKVSDATRKITEGDLGHKIEVKGGDEISDLSRNFNVMAQRLFESHSSLEQSVESLKESEARFRTLSEAAFEGIAIVDNGKIQEVSDAFALIFGYAPDEMIGMEVIDLTEPETRDMVLEFIKANYDKPYEAAAVKKDGTIFPCEVHGSKIPYKGQTARITALRDITDRKKTEKALQDAHDILEQKVDERTRELAETNLHLKLEIDERRRAEAALQEREEHYRALVETSSHGIQENDVNGVITFSNTAHHKMLGYEPGEMPGMAIWDFIDSETEKAALPEYFKILVNEQPIPTPYFARNRKKDGSTIDVQVDWNYKRGNDGNLTGFISVITDITENKRAEEERRKMEAQIQQSQRLESLGVMVGGISHDFNNILHNIQGFTDLLKIRFDDNSKESGYLDVIRAAVKRGRDLIGQILTFSKRSATAKKPVEIKGIIDESLRMLRSTLPPDIKINETADVATSFVNADASQIHQVIVNLCINASHAMPAGGELSVILTSCKPDEKCLCAGENGDEGPCVKLTIRDTGVGMDEETQLKIFDPFFTTKSPDRGTGLGLSVVYGIIKNHGGAITIESAPEKGTAFHIYLPAMKMETAVEIPAGLPVLPGSGGRVLFVDDEITTVEMIRESLEVMGYIVTAFNRSPEALEEFSRNKDLYDVFITDQVMPEMTGSELARHVRNIHPAIPILLCSGYDHINDEAVRDIGMVKLLKKPISAREISEAIQTSIAS